MTSPWKQINKSDVAGPILSLNEIMSEELAKDLQDQEEQTKTDHGAGSPSKTGDNEFSMNFIPEVDCSNDLMLAQFLQMEFDREHDKMLSLEETKLNGTSKGKKIFIPRKKIFIPRKFLILILKHKKFGFSFNFV